MNAKQFAEQAVLVVDCPLVLAKPGEGVGRDGRFGFGRILCQELAAEQIVQPLALESNNKSILKKF
jgi:hypothetical protein